MSEVDEQHHVLLGRGDRGQLEHLLQDPATHRWERPAEVDRELAERYTYNERGRKSASQRMCVRGPASRPNSLRSEPRHDDVVLDRIRRVVEHRPVQVRAQLEVRCEAGRDHGHSPHGRSPVD